MRTELVIIGTKSELLEHFDSLNIKPKDYIESDCIPPYNKEYRQIFEQLDEIDKKNPKFGIISWLHYKPNGTSFNGLVEHVNISFEKQFILILDLSDEEMKQEILK